jgi:hypothetical protein
MGDLPQPDKNVLSENLFHSREQILKQQQQQQQNNNNNNISNIPNQQSLHSSHGINNSDGGPHNIDYLKSQMRAPPLAYDSNQFYGHSIQNQSGLNKGLGENYQFNYQQFSHYNPYQMGSGESNIHYYMQPKVAEYAMHSNSYIKLNEVNFETKTNFDQKTSNTSEMNINLNTYTNNHTNNNNTNVNESKSDLSENQNDTQKLSSSSISNDSNAKRKKDPDVEAAETDSPISFQSKAIRSE